MGIVREIHRLRQRVRIGAVDPRLTGVPGMVAVTELVSRLGVIKLLDAAIGPIKTRGRGCTGGKLLVGVAAAQLVGEDFLSGLIRIPARLVHHAGALELRLSPGYPLLEAVLTRLRALPATL